MKYGILCLICLAVVGCTNAKKQIAENNTSDVEFLLEGCNWVRTDTLKGDSLGTEIFMKTLHDNYSITVQDITVIVANPTNIPLEFDWTWYLQKWNGYFWVGAKKNLLILGLRISLLLPMGINVFISSSLLIYVINCIKVSIV